MIGRLILSSLLSFSLFFFSSTNTHAQSIQQPEYSRGRVIDVLEQREIRGQQILGYTQRLSVRVDDGETVEVSLGSLTIPLSKEQLFSANQQVIVVKQKDSTGATIIGIDDQYRLPTLFVLFVIFCVLVVGIARLKGLLSLVGMLGTLALLSLYTVPGIVAGGDPLFISGISALCISVLIIYFGHGIGYRSHIALLCTGVTLLFTLGISHVVLQFASLTGIGDESAAFVQSIFGVGTINLQGLLLGGILLATLSVLDDGIVSQISIVYQLKDAKRSISFEELFFRSLSVGRDHIASLVNTLILAYAGASLPLFVLLFNSTTGLPLWVTLNQQMIAEEIVRTLVGSIALVCSIPLSTLVASLVIYKKHSFKDLHADFHMH